MPGRDNRTFGQLRRALHAPAVFDRLNANDKRFVDAMKEREDAGVATDYRHERLMQKLAREAEA